MERTPHVTVIIPNYNHARFLDERIRSVLDQTYRNFDVIILDDKSTDDSVEVIGKYRDNPKVSAIVLNEENVGSPFRQWRKGMEMAEGDLVWVAESDDSCDRTLLERNVGSFQKDERCVLSFTCSSRMDENGNLHQKIQDLKEDVTMDGKAFNRRYLYRGCYVANASSALFRKDVALKADDSYMEYKGGGDRVFWMEVASYGNVSIICDPLNYFRRSSSTTTSRLYKDGTDYYEAKKTYDFIQSKYGIGRRESRRICEYYVYRIKYAERFESERIRDDLLHFWKPGGFVMFLVDCHRFRVWFLNHLRRIIARTSLSVIFGD